MKFRKLRIAWSVLCGAACVLLILLWVRSYWWNDSVFKRLGSRELLLQMRLGEVGIWVTPTKPSQLPSDDTQWRIGKERPSPAFNYFMIEGSRVIPVTGRFGFRYRSNPQNTVAWIPFWAITLPVAGAAGVPWVEGRFSLRALLIATTLVAMVLGLIVDVLKWPAG
jgi:hypothetical protein